MLDQVFKNTDEYMQLTPKTERKAKGQFFTSQTSADFMASLICDLPDAVTVLEPGAGNGALTAAVVDHILATEKCKSISATFIESDPAVLPVLEQTINLLRTACENTGVSFQASVIQDNFITVDINRRFDFVVCNPPYKKIRRDSPEAIATEQWVYGQPNLYGLFMAKSISVLSDYGQFAFIVPRSWVSGVYFSKVREYVLENTDIKRIHLFKSRDSVFSSENVLQETMIFSGMKSTAQQEYIGISSSTDDSYEDVQKFWALSDLIKAKGKSKNLLIPSSVEEINMLSEMEKFSETFESLGYTFKTGPVVEFRSAQDISSDFNEKTQIPMFRSCNISNGNFVFPVINGKAQYISRDAFNMLLPDENTVLVRRLTAKEEARRLQSCIYYRHGKQPYISIENHVNYLSRKDGRPLEKAEVEWVQGLLSSELYDLYFRVTNGSTQVNARDLNCLPVKRVEL